MTLIFTYNIDNAYVRIARYYIECFCFCTCMHNVRSQTSISDLACTGPGSILLTPIETGRNSNTDTCHYPSMPIL